MPTSDQTTTAPDSAAVLLSVLCILHCLALPALAVSLPFLAAATEAEWVHWVFAILAVLASGTVVLTAPGARTIGFLLPACLGAAFVVGGLFSEGFGIEETIPTAIGGVLLAGAHLRRLFA